MMRYLSVCSGIEADDFALKTCAKCGDALALKLFHKQPNGPGGRHSWCKVCFNDYARETRNRKVTPEQRRTNNLWTRYRLRPSEADYLLNQSSGCAICGEVATVIDHDHATGKVRGALCHGCNIKLPAVEDDAFRESALRYLRRDA